MLSHAEEASAGEKVDVRQPSAHCLARVAAAMAEPEPEDVAATEAEGGDPEELAQAVAAAVPAGLAAALGGLLADRVLEVRLSALHAVKTLAKLRPSLLRAAECRVGCGLLGGVLACLQDKRNVMVASAAQRCLMHLALCCGWSETHPPSAAAVGNEASAAVGEFARKH
eukprot:1899901-Prymnesium_polylepis.1